MWTCQKSGVKKKNVWEGWKQYMYHKSSPLSHMKMPKTKPIL
jgi:hypothetical protein